MFHIGCFISFHSYRRTRVAFLTLAYGFNFVASNSSRIIHTCVTFRPLIRVAVSPGRHAGVHRRVRCPLWRHGFGLAPDFLIIYGELLWSVHEVFMKYENFVTKALFRPSGAVPTFVSFRTVVRLPSPFGKSVTKRLRRFTERDTLWGPGRYE